MSSIDFVFEWKEPPPSRQGLDGRPKGRRPSYSWTRHLAPLMSRPGEWAEVARCYSFGPLSATAARIKTGSPRQGAHFAALGHWEAVVRYRPEDEAASLYVRYLGSGDE